MTNLRQGRWPRLCLLTQGILSITAVTALELGAGLLLPVTAGAAIPAHTRRPLPSPLHAASITQGASHGKARHAQAVSGHNLAHPAGTHSRGSRPEVHSGSRAGSSGKRTKGRRRSTEQAPEQPIPMYRAHKGAPPLEHGARHGGHAQPVIAERRENATLRGHKGQAVAISKAVTRDPKERRPEVRVARNTALASSAGPRNSSSPAPVPAAPKSAPGGRTQIFAQGVSHPEGDERLPRVRTAPGDDSDTPDTLPAPIARVTAAPSGTPVVPPARTPVVQGFGSELAVPSSATPATDRPGGTRRRSHPSTWQPDASLLQPEPLEEREAMLDAAVSPAVLPETFDRGGRLLMPAPLRGSREVLVHQNLMAQSDGLEKIYDDAELDRMRAAHRLVNFPLSESLRLNPDLPWSRRVARPWTVAFTAELARAFYERFHQPLQVNSAVRTVRYQARLQLVNGNAAAIYGEAASPHLTGQAIDLAKRGMNQAELAWMRDNLLPLMRSGKIDVEEEFQQACFHISVYRSYTANRRTAQVAQVRGASSNPEDSDMSNR